MVNFANANPYDPNQGILGNPVYGQGILGGGMTTPAPWANPMPQQAQPRQGGGGALANNSNTLLAFGSSLLSNPTWGMALGAFGQQAPQALGADRKRKALNAYLKSRSKGTPLDPETQAYLASDPELADKYLSQQMGLTGTGQYGVTPIWGKDANGKTVLMQMNSRGGISPVDTGGIEPMDRVNWQDAGTSLIPTYQHGGAPAAGGAAPIPVDASGLSAAKAVGEAQGGARYILPATMAKAKNALATIQAIRSDPALSGGIGGTGIGGTGAFSFLNGIPGTGAYGFQQKVDQLKGQAFLDAYKDLKGGGAITNIEGDKATQAIARLSTAQTEADFKQALDDLEQIITVGMSRAQAMAGQPEAAPQAPDAGGWTDLGSGVRIRAVGQ